MQEAELRELVKAWVRAHSRTADAATAPMADDTDLLAAGLLDSLGFVELIVYVEEATGLPIDLDGVEPEEFTTVEGFARLAAGHRGAA
jgi:acyl carrier protein